MFAMELSLEKLQKVSLLKTGKAIHIPPLTLEVLPPPAEIRTSSGGLTVLDCRGVLNMLGAMAGI